MSELTDRDIALVESAAKVIRDNYDGIKYNHTVGAAVRCKNGKVYAGVNVYSVHGACAEIIAFGSAISAGERDFECVVAVGGDDHDMVYSPCGNCRQFVLEYAPGCDVILSDAQGLVKAKIAELIPFAYQRTD